MRKTKIIRYNEDKRIETTKKANKDETNIKGKILKIDRADRGNFDATIAFKNSPQSTQWNLIIYNSEKGFLNIFYTIFD